MQYSIAFLAAIAIAIAIAIVLMAIANTLFLLYKSSIAKAPGPYPPGSLGPRSFKFSHGVYPMISLQVLKNWTYPYRRRIWVRPHYPQPLLLWLFYSHRHCNMNRVEKFHLKNNIEKQFFVDDITLVMYCTMIFFAQKVAIFKK